MGEKSVMDAEHLLHVPQSQSDEHVVVNVKRTGSAPLDLRLIATDGSEVYVSEIKESKISKLKVKQAPVSEAYWKAVLSSTLLIELHNASTSDKFELAASITGTQLLLIFRRNISGITQRLGEIVLRKDDDEAIELYDWAAVAADRTRDLAKAMQDLDTKYQAQSNVIKKLNEQFEDLIQAKRDHETSLLQKFQALLNAKKLKIRDQQRLLAGAKVDPQKAAQIRDARQSQTSRSPEASRASKRKANEKSPGTEESGSDESGFEKEAAAEPDDDADRETPPHSDLDATEDEDEDEDLDSVRQSNPAPGKGKLLEGQALEEPVSQASSPTPPPPRQLPFASGKHVATTDFQSPSKMQTDPKENDSETSDDEL